jgi:hypothetical protein
MRRKAGPGRIGEMDYRIRRENKLLRKNGPIKVEDFGLDSKVVLFSFEKILFISITNLVYKSQNVTSTKHKHTPMRKFI